MEKGGRPESSSARMEACRSSIARFMPEGSVCSQKKVQIEFLSGDAKVKSAYSAG